LKLTKETDQSGQCSSTWSIDIYCRTSQTQKGLAEVYFNVTQEQQAVNELSILFLTEIPPYTQ